MLNVIFFQIFSVHTLFNLHYMKPAGLWVDNKKYDTFSFYILHSVLFYSWGLFSRHPTAGTSECHWKFVTGQILREAFSSSLRPRQSPRPLSKCIALIIQGHKYPPGNCGLLLGRNPGSSDITSTMLLAVMAIVLVFSDGVWIYKSADTGRTCGSGWFLSWAKSPAYTGWMLAASRILEVRDIWSWGFTAVVKGVWGGPLLKVACTKVSLNHGTEVALFGWKAA